MLKPKPKQAKPNLIKPTPTQIELVIELVIKPKVIKPEPSIRNPFRNKPNQNVIKSNLL